MAARRVLAAFRGPGTVCNSIYEPWPNPLQGPHKSHQGGHRVAMEAKGETLVITPYCKSTSTQTCHNSRSLTKLANTTSIM